MQYPQIVVFEPEDAIEPELRELASERRWLLRIVRQIGAIETQFGESRPTVLVLSVDPGEGNSKALAPLASLHRREPTLPIVVVSRGKLSEPDRTGWTASVYDLGARFVLYPPLTRAILEDLVAGLMQATCRRMGYELPLPTLPAIDLAEGDYEA